MSNEKENKNLKTAHVELLEKLGNQQILIAQLQKDGEEMGNEILHLKRVVAGQKGRLQQFSNEVHKLCEECNATIEEKDKSIAGLGSQINALKKTITERNEKIGQLKDELAFYKANYEYFKELPWYKRIFFKG